MKIGFIKKFKGNWQKSQLKQGAYLKSGKTKNLNGQKFDLSLGLGTGPTVLEIKTAVDH